jgi:hypothetical protein
MCRRRALAAPALLLVMLAGCADAGPSYLDHLNQLVGRPEAEAVSLLGAPDRVLNTDGGRFLGWTTISNRVVPGGYWPGGFYGRRGVASGFWAPDRFIQQQCVTTANIKAGMVQAFSLNGDCPR